MKVGIGACGGGRGEDSHVKCESLSSREWVLYKLSLEGDRE